MHFDFLVCSERSGSNLITRIMDSHPEVCGPSPVHLVRILSENRWRYGDLEEDGNWRSLATDAADLLAAKVAVWRTAPASDELTEAVSDRTLTGLLRYIYENEARAAGKTWLFIKENHLYRYLPFLMAAFPDARFLHQVRDPRDMALSWKNAAARRGGVLAAAETWHQDQKAARQLHGYLRDSERCMSIRYESLLQAPETVLPDVCRFLGLAYSPAMLDFAGDDLTVANAGLAHDWRNLSRPLMSANFAKYRRGLCANEIAYVEARNDGLMDYFGYPTETDKVADIAALEDLLRPREPQEKPGYEQVSEREKQMRTRWRTVVERIRARHPADTAQPL